MGSQNCDNCKLVKYFANEIKDTLLSGGSYPLDGIGVLAPKFRKVKNLFGREYAIKIVLKKDKEFDNALLKAYNENKEKFR